MITKQEERTMNENMSIEQQLQKIDEYINWLNADWENHKKTPPFRIIASSTGSNKIIHRIITAFASS